MAERNKKAAAAARLASLLVVACIAAVASAAGEQPQQKEPSKEIAEFCGNTGFRDTCIDSLKNAKSSNPKDLIKAAFDSAVAEIQVAIKNTTIYKEAEADKMTKGALDVCERVLESSIDDVRRSLDNINSFEVSKIDHALDDVQVWLSAAITNKETCFDAFAKTRTKTGNQVKELLKTSGELLSNGLAMVIEFQKIFQSVSKNMDTLTSKLKQRQLLHSDEEIPEYVTGHSRKLLQTPTLSLPPTKTVSKEVGGGDFQTIQAAVDAVPLNNKEPYVILVKAGTYAEYVTIPKTAKHIVMVGEGPGKTIITGNKCFTGGVQTYDTSTLSVNGEAFMLKDITIENTAGPVGHQAVAMRASADLGIFYNVHFEGYQDTLYAHTHRQLYRECKVSGTVDFIFGNAIAVFQKCDLVVRKPDPGQGNMVTAQGRTEKNLTGVTVVMGCKIYGEPDLLAANSPFRSYLGRPWKYLSRTIMMHNWIEGFILPEGWSVWSGNLYLDTLYFMEFENAGDGAEKKNRVKWPGIQQQPTREMAAQWTAKTLFRWDEWVLESGVPYDPEFMPWTWPEPPKPEPAPAPSPEPAAAA